MGLGLPSHKLLLDVKTMWNSTYLMMDRYMEQRLAVAGALADVRVARNKDVRLIQGDLDDLQVSKAQEHQKLMTCFYIATAVVSSENMPCASLILPIIAGLQKAFAVQDIYGDYIKKLKKSVMDDLGKRYQDSDTRNFLEEAAALDPHTKQKEIIPP